MIIARLTRSTRPDGSQYLAGELLADAAAGWPIFLVKAAEDTYELRAIEPRKIDSRQETLWAFAPDE